MIAKMRGVLPLAIIIAVLGFIYVEATLNFTFHWVTSGDLGNGLSLPSNFHLVTPAGFVAWGTFYMLGADNSAFVKTIVASIVGCVGALATMAIAPKFADLPDFWGISLMVAISAFVLVLLIPLSEKYNVAATFPAFASVLFWWLATGGDNWLKNGGGVGNSPAALASPATAGAGAFGGVLSTPYFMVFVDILVTLIIGAIFGIVSARANAMVSARLAPASAPTRETSSA